MKATIEIRDKRLNVSFAKKQTGYILERMLELNFSTKDRKHFSRTSPIYANEHDYLIGMLDAENGLGMPYVPTAEKGLILDTVVPDSMGYEMHIVMRKIKSKIKMSFFDYVAKKLHYTNAELSSALACEQIDGVALAIYNIEVRKQGIIISDQTGIGKGRQAAAMIRYGIIKGKQPIFISEKPNLFSDLYRDLVDIHSGHYVPFIVNARASKTDIKITNKEDKKSHVVYQAPVKAVQDAILQKGKVPSDYHFICATYSQFSRGNKMPIKPNFLLTNAKNNVLILDEAHNASGASKTGEVMRNAVRNAQGVCFLSATYAKRADNMPLYAERTAMKEANMTNDELVAAILNGGVALQEILAAQLVSEGQMIRRERTSEGIEVNYIELKHREKEHTLIADKVTKIMRDIAAFQIAYVKPIIKVLDREAKEDGGEVGMRKGTAGMGVNNAPYFSKVFNVVNQLLFSINAKDVALQAIKHLKEGRKPVIAFASTMGSFLEEMGGVDDIINADFTTVLIKGLQSVMTYTSKDMGGKSQKHRIELWELDDRGMLEYKRIEDAIDSVSTGIFISPIDVIIEEVEAAGYSVGEVTGRKLAVNYSKGKGAAKAIITKRKKENTNDLFQQFNDNVIDCLLINQSGSTGASAQAKPTDVVPESEVKQRVMIILQPELDINTEIQKRGRINRTGQIMKPIYDYIISVIPSQKRMMMMLKKKLKSLDANTTSNQKSNEKQLRGCDFLNKYGDYVVTHYLLENPTLNQKLDDPLGVVGADELGKIAIDEDAALRVSGRVAVLSSKDQTQFYNDVEQRYNEYVQYVKDSGDYDLEVEALNLKAETLETTVLIAGKGGKSDFGADTMLEICECDILKKPMKKSEVEAEVHKALNGKEATDITNDIIEQHNKFSEKRKKNALYLIKEIYDNRTEAVTSSVKYLKLETEAQRNEYLAQQKKKIESERKERIKYTNKSHDGKRSYINNFLKFFKIGKGYFYPSLGDMKMSVPAICLGVKVDTKRPNPFAPSALKIRFAISDSRRVVELVMSGEMGMLLNGVMAQSLRMSNYDRLTALEKWNSTILKYSKDRNRRFIITGNILQAAARFKAKLVSYTMKKGGIKKGILMPESWSPNVDKNKSSSHVIVPIVKVKRYMMSLSRNALIASENKMSFARSGDSFIVTMPKKKSHIPIYTDVDILKLLSNKQGFELISGDMRASVESDKMEKLINILGNRYSIAIKLSRNMFDQYVDSTIVVNDDKEEAAAQRLFEQDKEQFEEKLEKQKELKENDKVIVKLTKIQTAEATAKSMKLRLLKM